jgi:hypothetical protein
MESNAKRNQIKMYINFIIYLPHYHTQKTIFPQFFYKFLEFVLIVGRASFTHFYKFSPN